MIDVPTLFERSHTTRNSYDFDHTYCSEEEGYGVPLTQRLIQFRDEGIGCDVEFMVGSERKVSLSGLFLFSTYILMSLLYRHLVIIA
uniref:Uncharacterized protein n=1 Tax=Parascaris equorum TaxID=6256 RepID=A0A914RNN8_PAREQ